MKSNEGDEVPYDEPGTSPDALNRELSELSHAVKAAREKTQNLLRTPERKPRTDPEVEKSYSPDLLSKDE